METATQRLVRLLAEYIEVYPDSPRILLDGLTSDDPDNDIETLRDLVALAAKEGRSNLGPSPALDAFAAHQKRKIENALGVRTKDQRLRSAADDLAEAAHRAAVRHSGSPSASALADAVSVYQGVREEPEEEAI